MIKAIINICYFYTHKYKDIEHDIKNILTHELGLY